MNETTVNSIQAASVAETIFTKVTDISELIETFKKKFVFKIQTCDVEIIDVMSQ